MKRYCRVAIDSPVGALDRPFDYEIPQRMLGRVDVGSVVRVNLHGRGVRAFVTDLLDEPAVAKPRPLSALVSPQPVFDRDTIALAHWMGRRYVVPVGAVLHDAVPGRFSAPGASDSSRGRYSPAPQPSWLKDDLASVIARRAEACAIVPTATLEAELVAHGVSEARAADAATLVICPRVDVAEELAGAIAGSVTLHGEESPAARARAWAAARDGNVDVVVGTRSALLVPMASLGLVIVASAHDRSLKSERAPRYHALFVARRRARLTGAAFLASSPAPPVEAAGEGVTILRSGRGPVRPEIARPRKGPVTPRLVEVVRDAVAHDRDALVFVARRGGALRLRCTDCAYAPVCEACGAGLALAGRSLHCRMCGTSHVPVPDVCPSCGGVLSERGWGHDRVARELEKCDLGAAVVRIVRGAEVGVRRGPAVIVGTLAAAHEVRDAGAVVVADLDQLLTRPDFRASEYALQTLHELAAVLHPEGRFLVQTREPEHHVVQAFTRGAYGYFLDRELPMRAEVGYPPFGCVVRVEMEPDLVDDLRGRLAATGATVVGVVPRKGRVGALVRGAELEPLLDPLRRFALDHPRTKIDVDPVDLS